MQQRFAIVNDEIREKFIEYKRAHPDKFAPALELSWSNWGFGMEPLARSLARLSRAGIKFVELHGNHYGESLGYQVEATRQILADHDMAVSGICGMFSAENDLSSNSGCTRQKAVDYLKRTIDFAAAIDAGYVLVVPGAVGRPKPYDDMEAKRSVETLRLVADRFVENDIKAAIEPIRSAEVSFCHTVADALAYIASVGHAGVQHVNGDVFHMLAEERHIGQAIMQAGARLINLHMADSNRRALGEGCLDLDTIIMALYLINFNRPGCFVTPEPLGPGGDPYPAMYGEPDSQSLDVLVSDTATYFREREQYVRDL